MLSSLLYRGKKQPPTFVDFKITFGSVMFSHIVCRALFAMMEINNMVVIVARKEC